MPFEDNSKISEAPEGLRSEMFRPESHEGSWLLMNETGADRLKMMFDISRGLGPELTLVKAGFTIGGISGLLVGGINYARTAKINYIRRNQATPFVNPKQAMRELNDTMLLEFTRGGFKLGWRMAVFSTLYMTGITAGFTYRNKFGIAEHVASGALTGFLFKVNMGIRGSLVGMCLGGLLGLASGVVLCACTKFSGMTVPEFRYWSHNYWLQEYSEKKAVWKKEQTAKLSTRREGATS